MLSSPGDGFPGDSNVKIEIVRIMTAEYLTLNELTCFAGPAVRPLDDLQCTFWSGSVHISVLYGALWDV